MKGKENGPRKREIETWREKRERLKEMEKGEGKMEEIKLKGRENIKGREKWKGES